MDLTAYNDEDLDALRVAVLTEQERRRLIADAPAQVAPPDILHAQPSLKE